MAPGLTQPERVILVDRRDAPVGTEEKARVHRTGALHRAFSIFVCNAAGSLLLQRRAAGKYHSGGLWTNTCCSHPRPGETTHAAAHRRLREEMGFDVPLRTAFSFVYRAEVGGGLVEHEYDHVFTGTFDGVPRPDPREVEDWRWASPAEVAAGLAASPGRFTFWFRIAFDEMQVRGLL